MLKIGAIRLRYRIEAPDEARERVERLVARHGDHCPAYQSVKGCIDCTWEAEIVAPGG